MTDNNTNTENTNTENNIKDIKSIVDDAFNLFKSADIINDGENTFRFFETLLNRYRTFTKNNYYIEYEDFKFNLQKKLLNNNYNKRVDMTTPCKVHKCFASLFFGSEDSKKEKLLDITTVKMDWLKQKFKDVKKTPVVTGQELKFVLMDAIEQKKYKDDKEKENKEKREKTQKENEEKIKKPLVDENEKLKATIADYENKLELAKTEKFTSDFLFNHWRTVLNSNVLKQKMLVDIANTMTSDEIKKAVDEIRENVKHKNQDKLVDKLTKDFNLKPLV